MAFTFEDAQQFQQLRSPCVRDLAWCCLSAPLVQQLPGSGAHLLPQDGLLPMPKPELWAWLRALDRQPQPLHASLAQVATGRLGIYYERLWHFYFSHAPGWQLLAYNLPVYRQSITLGAFDFLCRYQNDYWHIETAVKFYLFNGADPSQAAHWQHWVGPGNQDRLDIKLSRLRDHQLRLHNTDEGRTCLQAQFPQVQWRSGLCLQGYLFSPAKPQENSAISLTAQLTACRVRPAHSHTRQGVGLWWRLDDFLALISQSHSDYWVILERQQWFAPIQLEAWELSTHSREVLVDTLRQIKKPLMVAALVEQISDGGSAKNSMHNQATSRANSSSLWVEQLRGFVVPNDWPNQAS